MTYYPLPPTQLLYTVLPSYECKYHWSAVAHMKQCVWWLTRLPVMWRFASVKALTRSLLRSFSIIPVYLCARLTWGNQLHATRCPPQSLHIQICCRCAEEHRSFGACQTRWYKSVRRSTVVAAQQIHRSQNSWAFQVKIYILMLLWDKYICAGNNS